MWNIKNGSHAHYEARVARAVAVVVVVVVIYGAARGDNQEFFSSQASEIMTSLVITGRRKRPLDGAARARNQQWSQDYVNDSIDREGRGSREHFFAD